jgi:hypothetical protein
VVERWRERMRSGLGTIQVGWRDRVMTGIVKIEEADHNCFILDVILKLLREESTWERCECGGGAFESSEVRIWESEEVNTSRFSIYEMPVDCLFSITEYTQYLKGLKVDITCSY